MAGCMELAGRGAVERRDNSVDGYVCDRGRMPEIVSFQWLAQWGKCEFGCGYVSGGCGWPVVFRAGM